MPITSRDDLKEYCLRRLGKPVIQINVDDEQLEDRIDDALQFFTEFHFDGVEKLFLKHQITATDLTNKYITIPDTVLVVKGIFPLENSNSTNSLFNVKYQFMMNEVWNFTSMGLLNFSMSMQYLNLMQDLLNGRSQIRFNRYQKQLRLDTDWSQLVEGQYLIIECFRVLDPEDYPAIYNDMFLKKYVTALFKRQWGSNLIKYEGIHLPGGVTFSSSKIYDDGVAQVEKLEEEMHKTFEFPISFEIA